MCCGPCSVYPASVLKEENIEFEGLFYNPNIHPWQEYSRRRENVDILSKIKDIKVNYLEGFSQQTWERFNGSDDARCNMCYSIRLEKTAAYAKEKGFDAFSTTLLVSPYQKHDLIMELGEKLCKKHGVEFYYRDFRPGFRQGQQQAREIGLYRQKFCGCIVSFNESKNRGKKA
jgi:predicted adenine nucleotide alpha hydrolase (AANH) superfamily ATPase